jgi:hypothetical protein
MINLVERNLSQANVPNLSIVSNRKQQLQQPAALCKVLVAINAI